jgi:hypothetical protein
VSGEIFINYRRADSGSYGALLYVDLVRHFGPGVVFMDSMSILAGSDFTVELPERVRRTRVLLAVIGPAWLACTDQLGRRLIDDPDDWVRRELALAFTAGVRVVPVLTDNAQLPLAAELPSDIAPLARSQYRLLRSRDVVADLDRLRRDLVEAVPDLAAEPGRSVGRPQVRGAAEAAAVRGAPVAAPATAGTVPSSRMAACLSGWTIGLMVASVALTSGRPASGRPAGQRWLPRRTRSGVGHTPGREHDRRLTRWRRQS